MLLLLQEILLLIILIKMKLKNFNGRNEIYIIELTINNDN